jgi:Tol biopolymer transport system component
MEFKSGKWSKPKYIKNETINTSFFDGSATMSADGNTMVFVSDRNGEKSSTDLFIVKKVGKKWGEAVALPEYINSNFRETTPSLSPDGNLLFFSSDGLLGMGGYDVYVTEFSNGKWSKPVNLGCQFNTVNDDTHFQWYPSLSKAVMAGVTVDEGQSNYNIYEIEMSNVEIPGVTKK